MIDVLTLYAQFKDPENQGIAQIAAEFATGFTNSKIERDFLDYTEASRIIRDHLPDVREYQDLSEGSQILTIGTGIISLEKYGEIVEELLQVKKFDTEPRFNERLDGIIAKVTLLGESSSLAS